MKAVIQEAFGEPAQVLRVAERAVPEPGPGQVRVRMLASPVNPSDLMLIRGRYSIVPPLPATPGLEGVGVVEAAGPGLLGRVLVGRRVCLAGSETGTWAERTIVAARQASLVPADVPVEQAAMFLVNPVTAYVMTRVVLAVPKGEWLLQTAAGSALGRMVIRLGRRFGFRTLCVVRPPRPGAGRPEQIERLRALGADACVAVADDELPAEVRRLTGGGVRCAIDPVGGPTGSAVVRCLAPGGRLLVFGTLSGQPLSFSPRDLMTPGTAVEGFWLGNWMRSQPLLRKLRVLWAVSRLVREGVLVSPVGERFPLDRVADAVRAAEAPGRDAKVLLEMG